MGASTQHPPGPVINGVHFRPCKAIAYWRKARKLTQVQCAARMGGYSVRAWQKWEGGDRTPGVDVWIKIAAVLRVDVADLLGVEFAGYEPAEPVGTGAVLFIQDALIGLTDPGEVAENEAGLLAQHVEQAWMRWQNGHDERFDFVGQQLPGLITRVEAASRAYTGDALRAVHATATSLYHLTWAYLRARGALSWARDAAYKARVAAENSGNATTAAAGTWGYAAVLSTVNHTEAAYRLLDKAISELEPTLDAADMGRWEVFGQMNLLQAVQAIRLQRPEDAQARLDVAGRVAQRLPVSNHHHTAFGAVNTDIHRTAVALEAGKYKTAVTLGEAVDVDAAGSMERKVAFLVQLSHAYLRAGRIREAVESLGQAVDLSKRETAGLRLAQETAWGLAPKRANAYAKRLDHVMTSLGLAS